MANPVKCFQSVKMAKMKPIELKKHIVRGTCAVKHCTKKCKGQLCSTCRCRKSRIEDPERYAFNNLKNKLATMDITKMQPQPYMIRVNEPDKVDPTLTAQAFVICMRQIAD